MTLTQYAFIKGRQIFDDILIANEILHSIDRNGGSGGSLIFNLNFTKAFNYIR